MTNVGGQIGYIYGAYLCKQRPVPYNQYPLLFVSVVLVQGQLLTLTDHRARLRRAAVCHRFRDVGGLCLPFHYLCLGNPHDVDQGEQEDSGVHHGARELVRVLMTAANAQQTDVWLWLFACVKPYPNEIDESRTTRARWKRRKEKSLNGIKHS